MAKRGLIEGFLSKTLENQNVEQLDSQKGKSFAEEKDARTGKQSKAQKKYLKNEKAEKLNRTVKYKEWEFKGFYISQENELRLKELEILFLKLGKRMDLSDILNLAIEKLYASMSEL